MICSFQVAKRLWRGKAQPPALPPRQRCAHEQHPPAWGWEGEEWARVYRILRQASKGGRLMDDVWFWAFSLSDRWYNLSISLFNCWQYLNSLSNCCNNIYISLSSCWQSLSLSLSLSLIVDNISFYLWQKQQNMEKRFPPWPPTVQGLLFGHLSLWGDCGDRVRGWRQAGGSQVQRADWWSGALWQGNICFAGIAKPPLLSCNLSSCQNFVWLKARSNWIVSILINPVHFIKEKKED